MVRLLSLVVASHIAILAYCGLELDAKLGRRWTHETGGKANYVLASEALVFRLTGEYEYSRIDLQRKGEMQTTVSNVRGNRVHISRKTMKSIHAILVGTEMAF